MPTPEPINLETKYTNAIRLVKTRKPDALPFEVSEIHSVPATILHTVVGYLRNKKKKIPFSRDDAKAAIRNRVRVEDILLMAIIKGAQGECTAKIASVMGTCMETHQMLSTITPYTASFNITTPEDSENPSVEAVTNMINMMATYLTCMQHNLDMLWKCDFAIHRTVKSVGGQAFQVTPSATEGIWDVVIAEQALGAQQCNANSVEMVNYMTGMRTLSYRVEENGVMQRMVSPFESEMTVGVMQNPFGMEERACRAIMGHLCAVSVLNEPRLLTLFGFQHGREDAMVMTFVQKINES